MPRRLLPGLISLCIFSGAQAAEPLPVIEVLGEAPEETLGEVIESTEFEAAPVDTGEWLRSLPGVSGTRLGGHGIDPVVRGQGETRVNILLDGAYVHGGCPNRMDPATSYAPLSSYDRVTLIRGNQTVRYGGGGSGGTLLLDRYTEPFMEDERYRFNADAAYGSNGDRREAYIDTAVGSQQAYARLIAGLNRADNYEDGDGAEVRSAYDERGANMLLGFLPNADTRIELGFEAIRGEDILYAGGMDSPTSDNDVARLKFAQANIGPAQGTLGAELYYSDVYHVMDNFSLRPLTAMMKMSVPSDSTTRGGRVQYEVDGHDGWLVGIDYQRNNRDAIRYSGPTLAVIDSYMWPGVELDQVGVFAEYGWALDAQRRLRGGLRYDRVDASASLADADPAGMMLLSPNQLYDIYYDRAAEDVTENNVGGFLRYAQDLTTQPVTLSATLSRSVRTADATERFMAANGMPDQRWVGNPGLDPEQHHQLELGVDARVAQWSVTGAVYVDDVSDYILRDRAHSAVPAVGNATIYRNVDARLYGGELRAGRTFAQTWLTDIGVGFVRGTNRSDDRDLAQIPPLEMDVGLRYLQPAWDFGGALRMVARQTEVDDDPILGSGLDTGETAGFAVLDLNGSYALTRQIDLRYGIDNVFDRAYAEHLNRSNDFDPLQVQINEPGRNYWLRLQVAL